MAIIHADDNNFQDNISKGVVLVDFYADWCGPCKMVAPELERLARDMTDISIIKLNVDNSPTTARKYEVMSIPTLLLFKEGKQVAKTIGFKPKDQLVSWIDSYK